MEKTVAEYKGRPESGGSDAVWNQSLILDGVVYKDKLYVDVVVDVSLWGRIKNLFCPQLSFGVEIYMDGIVPKHKAVPYIRSIPWLRLFRNKYFPKKGLMQAPNDIQ